MQARHSNLIWLFCALLLAFQSLLPLSAMVSVSVRCVGAPATVPACSQTMVPAADATEGGAYLASMPCCRHRHSLSPTMSAPTCLVTVNPMYTERAAAIVSVRQWMLFASPALAPPVSARGLVPALAAEITFPQLVTHLAFSPPLCLHGLRAPPVV